MLKAIPSIEDKLLGEQTEELKEKINAGKITDWLNEELMWLSSHNPVLYKYLTDHAQKFAMGAVMVGDPHSIAMSQALEQIMLLKLIDLTLVGNEELKKFTAAMEKMLGGGKIDGLDGFGNVKK